MPGPSGYTTAFTHPDPLDPNDRVRQKTQGRSKGDTGTGTGHQGYPYDQPVSYGKEVGADMGGASYQVDGGVRPPPGEEEGPDRPLSVWDRLSDLADAVEDPSLRSVEIGPQGQGADVYGYGRNGLRDGLDPFELEMDALRRDFRDSYRGTRSHVGRMDAPSLFALLVDLDPEYMAQRFAPEDDSEMLDTYDTWALGFGGPEEEP